MIPIEIENLTKVYRDKKRRKVTALTDLSLKVEEGEIIGFLGPNGAGKSTTIKTLVGLVKPTTGTVRLFGQSVNSAMSRSELGYLPENPAFYDFLSAREYLSMVGKVFGLSSKEITKEADRTLDLMDLREAEKRPIRTYSKGMVQRLGLAQTLMHDPKLYILDEPMSGLDPLGRALVKDILRDLKNRGKTVFFSTHVTADVEAVCDRVAVIVSGRLQTVSKVQDVLAKGVEGYLVQYSDCLLGGDESYEPRSIAENLFEVFVPAEKLEDFMLLLSAEKGKVQGIETRRRDLETFFLDIVKTNA